MVYEVVDSKNRKFSLKEIFLDSQPSTHLHEVMFLKYVKLKKLPHFITLEHFFIKNQKLCIFTEFLGPSLFNQYLLS